MADKEEKKKVDLTPDWALINKTSEQIEDIFTGAKGLGPLDYRIIMTRLELMLRDFEMRLFIEHMAKELNTESHDPVEFKGSMFQ